MGSTRYMIPAFISGPCSDKLFELIHRHVHAACDEFTGVARPFICLLRGQEHYGFCKDVVAERLISTLSETMSHVEKQVDAAMDLENLLGTRMRGMSPSDFEGLLHPVFQEDEWKLVLMGGVLGVIVGCGQWYFLGS